MKRILRAMFFLFLLTFAISNIPNAHAEINTSRMIILSEIEQMRKEQHEITRAQIIQNYKIKKAKSIPSKQTPVYKPSLDVITGYAPHYGIGVMERVSKVRKLPLVPCMVSSPYQKIGTWVRVESLIDNDVLDCRVTDVSAPKDRPRHIASHWAVELDFTSAKLLCNISRVGQEPARKCPVKVTVLDQNVA